MTVYVAEYQETASGRYRQSLDPAVPLVSYSLSSGSTPALPNPNSNYITVSADGGSYLSFASTSTSAITLTATNALRLPPNVLTRLNLPVSSGPFRIQVSST